MRKLLLTICAIMLTITPVSACTVHHHMYAGKPIPQKIHHIRKHR